MAMEATAMAKQQEVAAVNRIDDFDFAMNSINWIIDTQITEKRPVYYVRLRGLVGKMVVQCFNVNGKKQ